jgi:hypothetical protein
MEFLAAKVKSAPAAKGVSSPKHITRGAVMEVLGEKG